MFSQISTNKGNLACTCFDVNSTVKCPITAMPLLDTPKFKEIKCRLHIQWSVKWSCYALSKVLNYVNISSVGVFKNCPDSMEKRCNFTLTLSKE